MLKGILIALGVIIGVLILLIVLGVYYFLPSENKILNFIKNNPSRSSILLVRNGTIIMGKNIDKIMPLASTVKIILAIEYAEQSANGQLNPDKMVSINELDKFYIPIPMAALIQVG